MFKAISIKNPRYPELVAGSPEEDKLRKM